MSQDLNTLSDLVNAVLRWDDGQTPTVDLLKAVFEVLAPVVPGAVALRLYRKAGDHLVLASATDSATPTSDKPSPLTNYPDHARALQDGGVVATADGTALLYAPARGGRREIVLELALDKSADHANATAWLQIAGGQIVGAVARRVTQLFVQRQAEISSRLTQATTFKDIAAAIAQGIVGHGQFININLIRYDKNGAIIGVRVIAAANRKGAQEINLTVPLADSEIIGRMREAINGKTVIHNDLQEADDIAAILKHTQDGQPIRASVTFPMRAQGRVLGTINYNDMRTTIELSDDELELMQSIVDQAASIISLRNLSEETALSQQISERQARVFNELVAGLDYQGMVRVLMRHMIDAGKLLSIGQIIYDDARRITGWEVQAVANDQRLFEWEDDALLNWDDLSPLLKNSIIDNEIFMIEDVSAADSDEIGDGLLRWLGGLEAGSYLSVPIATDQQPLAVMVIVSRRRAAFTRDEVNAYRNISELMGALIDVTRLTQQTADARQAVDNLVLANRLISSATNYSYMTQAVTYTLARGATGTALTLFDRPIAEDEKPNAHQIVAFSTIDHTYNLDEPYVTSYLTTEQLTRLHDGLPVYVDPERVDTLIPDTVKQSLNVPPQKWLAVFGLRAGRHLLGTLSIIAEQAITLNEDDINAYTSLADQIGLTVRTRQLLQESRNLQTVAAQLIQAEQAIATAEDYIEMGRVVLQLFPPEINAAAILLFDRPASPDDLPHEIILHSYITRHTAETPMIVDVVDRDYSRWRDGLEIMARGEFVTRNRVEVNTDTSNPNAARFYMERGYNSFVTAGLRAGRRLIGFLTLVKEPDYQPDEGQLSNLRAIADQTATAIENRQLLERTAQSLTETQTLYSINRGLLTARAEADILKVIYHQATAYCTGVVIARIDYIANTPSNIHIEKVYDGELRDIDQSISVTDDNADILDAIEERFAEATMATPVYVAAIMQDVITGGIARIADCDGAKSAVLIPAFDQGRLTRLIVTTTDADYQHDTSAEQIFSVVRDQVEVVLQNQRLVQETQASAARLQNQVNVLRTINYLSGVISGTLNQQALFDNTAESLFNALEPEHVGVVIYDRARGEGVLISEYPSADAIGLTFPDDHPILSAVRESKEPVIVSRDGRYIMPGTIQLAAEIDVDAVLFLPLLDQAQAFIGYIGLDFADAANIRPETVDIATAITAQIVVALRNIRLLEDSRREASRMEMIATYGRAVQGSLDVEELLETGIQNIREVIDADYSAIALLDRAANRPRRVAWQIGKDADIVIDPSVGDFADTDDTTGAAVWQKRESVIVADHRADDQPSFSGDATMRSSITMPFFTRGELRGMAELGSRRREAYDMQDRFILQQLVTQLGVAIENAEVFQQSQRLAQREAVVNQISTRLQAAGDVENMLNQAAISLRDAMKAGRVSIRLGTPPTDKLQR
ncbi:MAG: GAF domain-containing protein [Anaerolineaceae bacterium]|nr:MAG: GAF domain-containing protein [Anaerolineaceae bacterium]